MEPNIDIDRISLEERIKALESRAPGGGGGGGSSSSSFLISPDVVEGVPNNTITEVDGGYVLRLELDDVHNHAVQGSGFDAWAINLKLAAFYPKINGRFIRSTISWIRIDSLRPQTLNRGMMARLPGFSFGSFQADYIDNAPVDLGSDNSLLVQETDQTLGFYDQNGLGTYFSQGVWTVRIRIPNPSGSPTEIYITRTATTGNAQLSINQCVAFGIVPGAGLFNAPDRSADKVGYTIIGGEELNSSYVRDPYAFLDHSFDPDVIPEFIKKAYPSSWVS